MVGYLILTLFALTYANGTETCQELKAELGHLKDEIKELKQLIMSQHSRKGRKRTIAEPFWDHCPNGSVRHDNSCYIVSHQLASWPDALVYCEAYGANLAFIETVREQTFIKGHLQNVAGAATDPNHYFWIGGNDAVSESEWFWAKTVKPVQYTNWAPGNPDNSPAHASKHQDCMAIFSNGLWDDGYCEDAHNFICEITLDQESQVIVG